MRSVEETANRLAGVLVAARRFGREIMNAAMNIGVFGLGELRHGREDASRLLRRSRIVEIGERLAINLAGQDLELSPRAIDVERQRLFQLDIHVTSSNALERWFSMEFQMVARILSSEISATASSRKARTSSSRDSASGIPRARR